MSDYLGLSFSIPIPAIGTIATVQTVVPFITVLGLRLINPLKYLLSYFIASVFYQNRVVTILFLCLLLILTPISILGVHPNPHAQEVNNLITPENEEGIKWFIHHKSRDIKHKTLSIRVLRRYGYLFNSDEIDERSSEFRSKSQYIEKVPRDIDYSNREITDIYEEKKYVLTNKRDTAHHLRNLDGYYYDKNLFEQLTNEPGSNKIYSGGNTKVYLVD